MHATFGLSGISSPCRSRAHDVHTFPNLMKHLNGCTRCPATGLWMQAIRRGHCLGWPSLTAFRVQRYLPKSEETALGHHLKLVKQGTRLTSKGAGRTQHTSRDVGRRQKVMACSKESSSIMGTDQNGGFPVTSRQNHKCVFIMFDEDVDFMHAVLLSPERPERSQEPSVSVVRHSRAVVLSLCCIVLMTRHQMNCLQQ